MVFFIGTLHGNFTPHDELLELVESFNPSRLLIEMTQADIESGSTEKYPDEMQAALAWATDKHIKVYGIDSDIKTLKDGVTDDDLKLLAVEQSAVIRKHDWKEFNKPTINPDLETKTWLRIIDKAKEDERNLEMFKNVRRQIDRSYNANTVVITGSGHIRFFNGKFAYAHFPLSLYNV